MRLAQHQTADQLQDHDGTVSGSFDETNVGLDHLALSVADTAELETWLAWLDQHDVPHSDITLTTRDTNKLTPTQAQTVIAAAILRHQHAVITSGLAWDPVLATHGTRYKANNTVVAA